MVVDDDPDRRTPNLGDVTVRTDDVNEIRATNAGLALCAGDFAALVQDDMLVGPGWAEDVTAPLRLWPDVFAAGGKRAYTWHTDMTYGSEYPAPGVFRVRHTADRGPLALRLAAVQALGGEMDEVYCPLFTDD